MKNEFMKQIVCHCRLDLQSPAKLALLVGAFLFASCDDFLETPSNSVFTEETVFSNLDFAQKQLFSVYSALTATGLYGDRLYYAHAGSDIEIAGNNNNTRYSLALYTATESTSEVGQIWTAAYVGIELANIAIDNLPVSPIWNGEYADEAKALYGEAVTLRALLYYELISIFGDVPFTVRSTQSGDNFYLPKTDRDEIYEYLIEDLRKVEDYVPWMTNTAERVTKGFVKGLRARMALAYAGYSLRNKTFETRRGRYWQEYYSIANRECREIVSGQVHFLNPDFRDVFKSMCAYKQDIACKEKLFEIAFGRGNPNAGGRVAYVLGMVFRKGNQQYGDATPVFLTPLPYYYSFDRQDLRRNVTVELYCYNNSTNLEQQIRVGTGEMRTVKFRRSWLEPLMGGDLGAISFDGVNWPIMRYSDILLMLAETENEINGAPTPDAKDALRQVRERAFPQDTWDDHVTAYLNALNTKEDFFNAIVDERAFEFGGEYLRKFDLVRWNLLGDKTDRVRDFYQRIVDRDSELRYVVPQYQYSRYIDAERLEILPDYEILPEDKLASPPSTYTYNGYDYSRSNWAVGITAGTSNITKIAQILVPGYSGSTEGYVKAKNNHLLPLSANTITSSHGALENDQIPPK
jgi:hypothetical protein